MSQHCGDSCSSCSLETEENNSALIDFSEKPHRLSKIKKVIGVVSGKGGVGKSLVTSMMAVLMKRRGYNTAVLDADITGPSIPKIFGLKEKPKSNADGIFPVKSRTDINIMSLNLLLKDDTDPVVWRGPIIAGTVKQFWTDVIWGDIDFMFIDMPPGTGDVPLTVFQSIPVDGIIIVTSPQELVSMIVSKAVKMAEMMDIPVLALVENMSYLACPDCQKKIQIFGESHVEEIGKKYNIDLIAKMPIEPEIASKCDGGLIEDFQGDWLNNIVENLGKMGE